MAIRKTGGVIIEKKCTCGKYQPCSTKGIINTNCKNCGGKKPIIYIRKNSK